MTLLPGVTVVIAILTMEVLSTTVTVVVELTQYQCEQYDILDKTRVVQFQNLLENTSYWLQDDQFAIPIPFSLVNFSFTPGHLRNFTALLQIQKLLRVISCVAEEGTFCSTKEILLGVESCIFSIFFKFTTTKSVDFLEATEVLGNGTVILANSSIGCAEFDTINICNSPIESINNFEGEIHTIGNNTCLIKATTNFWYILYPDSVPLDEVSMAIFFSNIQTTTGNFVSSCTSLVIDGTSQGCTLYPRYIWGDEVCVYEIVVTTRDFIFYLNESNSTNTTKHQIPTPTPTPFIPIPHPTPTPSEQLKTPSPAPQNTPTISFYPNPSPAQITPSSPYFSSPSPMPINLSPGEERTPTHSPYTNSESRVSSLEVGLAVGIALFLFCVAMVLHRCGPCANKII